ncbi:hypothetical protein [Pseudomonas fluorescens]|uniref:hypothetical protein n=1 Tax=Pseudomonas fluorescens TaxID=294 RepID=UPI00161FD325|nr:hypothetical protein [Pseudomonas fluorescens]
MRFAEKRRKPVNIGLGAIFVGNRCRWTSDSNGVEEVRQGLFVTLQNKLKKTVKVLFYVMGFGVLRRQTAETCNTGGVFQDPFCVQFT